MIKITPETKISELIPDGYCVNDYSIKGYTLGSCETIGKNEEIWNLRLLMENLRKKDFDWYVEKYTENTKIKAFELFNLLRQCHFEYVPFEIKIGLLKFICDDVGMPIESFLHKMYDTVNPPALCDKIKGICPKEFLPSIFK